MPMENRPVKDEAEYIVVGTGAGGGTVVRELARRGKAVVMVEKGEEYKKLGSPFTLFSVVRKGGLVTTKEGHLSACAIMTGGSSIITAGAFTDPPAYLKEKWGIDLKEELEETKQELNVQKMPENLCGPAAMKVLEAAEALGYKWDRLPKMIDPSKCQEGCSDCVLGCKRGAKWTVRTYLEEAKDKGSKLYEKIDVQAVTHQNGRATGVWGLDGSGREVAFRGDKVIIAAGGMNSARILLRSGLWDAGDGFFMDPIVSVFGIYTGPEKMKGTAWGVPMGVGSWEFWDSHGILLYTFIAPRLAYAAGTAKNNPRHLSKLRHYGRLLSIQAKVKDEVQGRVFLDGSISKPLTPSDFKKLDTGAALAREILIKAGCSPKTIYSEGYGGSHPGGTARMGQVVDKNLETQIKNLYVGDASIFPEAFGRPPTGTIISMSKRLAKHLTGQGSD